MEDNTHQLNAVIFEAMEFLVKTFADGDDEREAPEYYHESAVHVQQLSLATEAIPCTILAAFDDNQYKDQIEISVKALERTFHTEKDKSDIR